MTTAERKIAAYKAKEKEPRKTVVRVVEYAAPALKPTHTIVRERCDYSGYPRWVNVVDVYPDGAVRLDGQPVPASSLPEWAKKYVG